MIRRYAFHDKVTLTETLVKYLTNLMVRWIPSVTEICTLFLSKCVYTDGNCSCRGMGTCTWESEPSKIRDRRQPYSITNYFVAQDFQLVEKLFCAVYLLTHA